MRYVIGPDVAIELARNSTAINDQHQLLAPTLLRSEILSLLYRKVREGELTKQEAVD